MSQKFHDGGRTYRTGADPYAPAAGVSVGSRVSYRGGFGTDPASVATVTGTGEKNGRVVYMLSDGHWCYGYQVERVLS